MEVFVDNEISKDDFEPVNTMIIKDYLVENFIKIIQNISSEEKDLLIDEKVFKFINFAFTNDMLKEKGVKTIRILQRNKNSIANYQNPVNNVIFALFPDTEIIDEITEFIYRSSIELETKFTLLFIPGTTYEVLSHLQSHALVDRVQVASFEMDVIPFGQDILSLEDENAFKDIFVLNKLDTLNSLARAIVRLELGFGAVKNKFIKGDLAFTLNNLLDKEEKANCVEQNVTGEVFGCIMIDRSVDFITPFLSNYTYEGLLDEFFGISYNVIKVKEGLFDDKKKKDKKADRKVDVSENKNLYVKIRNMPYPLANKYLTTRIDFHNNMQERAKELKAGDIKELKQSLQDLNRFLKEEKAPLIEHCDITAFIEKERRKPKYRYALKFEQILLASALKTQYRNIYQSYICNKEDISLPLRMMILESQMENGIENYISLRQDLIGVYGQEAIFKLRDLERAGLIKESGSGTKLRSNDIVNKLNCLNMEFSLMNIKDCSYICDGFCPISLRLIEAVFKDGWKEIRDALELIPGKTYYPTNERELMMNKKEKNFIFVVFIGGVTYGEIEGIRFLNQINKEFKMIVLTTGIINGKKILDMMGRKIAFSLSMKEFFEASEKENPRLKKNK